MRKNLKWTAEELEFVRENYAEHGPKWCVQHLPHRTVLAVEMKAFKLDVTRHHQSHKPSAHKTIEHRFNDAALREALLMAPAPVVGARCVRFGLGE